MSQIFYAPIDPSELKRERQKARDLKKTTWWRQRLNEGVCYYCEEKKTINELTMDHKVPLGRGGKSTKGNIVVCCKSCNSKKQSKTPVEMVLEAEDDLG